MNKKYQKHFHQNTKKLSDAGLMEALRRKQICNERAHKIVEGFIEGIVDEKNFLEKINFIAPAHYDDIIEERSILKICGYPLCGRMLVDIPSQKYVISTVTNKVYDISEKKKYCTGYCFKASNFIRDQIPSSPLWLRTDNSTPIFKLLKTETIS